MKRRLPFLSCIAIFTVFALVAGCIDSNMPQQGSGSATPGKGVSFSPKSMDQGCINGFFMRAGEAGDTVSWAGDWDELAREGSGADFVASETATKGMATVIMPQFFTQSDGSLLRPLDDATRQRYADSAADFAAARKVKYLGLGIEVNVLYEKSPEDFGKFVTLFEETYDAVKAKSPETKVFTVFQLERMKGLNGGLYGGVNDPAAGQWALIDRFPKADMVGFTTYPGLIYKDPAEIPADYYKEIGSHTPKPVAFTEIGWHSEAWPEGWESSDAEQAAFVTRFFELTGDTKPELSVWSFMYDPAAQKPFDSMGLYRKDGSPKSSWDAWAGGA